MDEQWTEERLREIVERRWPGTKINTLEGSPEDGVVSVTAKQNLSGPGTEIWVQADDQESGLLMLAAAVVAPDLWALVEAARKWEKADRVFKTKRRLPDGSAVALQAAETNLRAALARVDGKKEGEPTMGTYLAEAGRDARSDPYDGFAGKEETDGR